jgi:nitroreductase
MADGPDTARSDTARSDTASFDTAPFDTVIRTTFAARTFTDAEVTDDEIAEILDLARFAPSGGNRQGWRVVVVRDPERKRQVIEAGIPMLRRYVAESGAGHSPANTITPSPVTDEQVAAVSDEQLDWFRNLATAPVLIVVGVDLSLVASVDAALDRVGVASGASIYPFVHNVLLVARSRGLAGALTTFPAAGEPDVQRLLGLPAHVAVAAVVPLGRPADVLTRLRRNPVDAFARFEHWDGPPVTMGA